MLRDTYIACLVQTHNGRKTHSHRQHGYLTALFFSLRNKCDDVSFFTRMYGAKSGYSLQTSTFVEQIYLWGLFPTEFQYREGDKDQCRIAYEIPRGGRWRATGTVVMLFPAHCQINTRGGIQNIPYWCRHLYISYRSAKHRSQQATKCEFRVLLRRFAATAWERAKTSPRTLAITDLASLQWQRPVSHFRTHPAVSGETSMAVIATHRTPLIWYPVTSSYSQKWNGSWKDAGLIPWQYIYLLNVTSSFRKRADCGRGHTDWSFR
jgi:hypothetical protein